MKKQTKRLLALLLSAALCASFAGCSSDTSETGTTETSAADTTAEASTTTEIDAGDSGADYDLDASVYQSGNTIEAVASGSFIEDFLTMAGEQTDCEFYMNFETEDGGGFIFNVIPDGEYLWGYCYDFNVDDGSEPDMMYGGDSIAFSWQGYTGDFSELTTLYVYVLVGDEYLDGGAFEIGSVMLDSSIFGGGGEYVDADGAGDAVADQDAQDSTAKDFFKAFEGDYYVYNANYALPLTVTSEYAGEMIYTDIAFFHNDYTYHTRFSVDDLVATVYGDTCIVFTKDEDNVIASFMLDGSTPYVSIYINCSDGDTGAGAAYDYKREDQITTVDDAFVSEYMGEYLDIESGADLCNLGLYNGGYLAYKDLDGASYTVDTILGAELVNGNEVNVTLTASDGTTFDARIWFGYSGSALRANVNGGWTMEAVS